MFRAVVAYSRGYPRVLISTRFAYDHCVCETAVNFVILLPPNTNILIVASFKRDGMFRGTNAAMEQAFVSSRANVV